LEPISFMVCDETINIKDLEENIPIGNSLSFGSQIDLSQTNVEVSVARCDLIIDLVSDQFTVNIGLFIIKNITIISPGLSALILKFSLERFFPGIAIKGIRPSQVDIDLNRLQCDIFSLKADDTFQLNVEDNAFSEWLTVTTVVKLLFIDQISLPSICPCPHVPTPPPVPPAVNNALEILKGKIREQIGNVIIRNEFLEEVDKTIKLLKLGKAIEALTILNTIDNELQEILNIAPSRKIQINLVLRDLINVDKAVKSLL
jgi:hypothetical protein